MGSTVTATRAGWRRPTVALLALLLLNAALSFSTWWPTPGIVLDHRLAPEFVWLWLAILLLVAWRGRLGDKTLTVLTTAYLLLVLGRYADITAPSLFGRPINLYWDGLQIPRFLWVSAQELAWWQSGGMVALVLVFLGLLFALLRWGIQVAARDAAPYALRHRWTWAITGMAVLLAVGNLAGVQATWPVVSKPVIPTYWRQAGLLVAAVSDDALEQALPARTAVDDALERPDPLAALAGRDVYLIMLESVGAIVVDDPRASVPLRPVRERFAADVAASGRRVVSAYFTSPTFAGGSDLAHLGLLAAMDLRDPFRHDLLLTTDRPTLNTLFRRHGYQTFGLYPAVSWEWPERAFYGFDVYLEGRQLGYPGPELGYWKIPDPFSIARLEQLFPRDPAMASATATPPRFVFFPTITPHLPFSPVPPFQPDWTRLLTEQPYEPEDTARALAERPNWLDMFPDYLRMVDYTYRWLGSHLRQPEPREAVYLLVGDHQPSANITGEGVSWDVPVHIVSRDDALLQGFRDQGFQDGMEPQRATLGPLHSLTGMALQVFAGEPVATPRK
jgi:hypothetical protein